ncbi:MULTISPECIES: hypothetical protein [unclassified Sphingomonas]|uniref:hypothetical protein n=1 Tax=unclassified Sphingomonas TaxID=196159 RepID=UPI00285E8531|nr:MULTISPECIES: hypothetical protein [unclassified Sphingomonas]MDR6114816.1 hypothetical protein [Sphingomonas sp. SORGH_AS_0789]MDR6151511.1 hypothetical protein [Sphingomonas sp. SORGH_AS_0742]
MARTQGLGRIRIGLFLLVWLSGAWFGSWEFNPNNATRLFAAIRMVENGTASIDPFAPLTIDKAQFGNHAYLDKAPGMTLMALPAVAITDLVTGDRAGRHIPSSVDPGFVAYLKLRTRVAAATGSALLTAIAAVLLFDLALTLTGGAGAALFAALGYALGTPIWGYSTTLLGHAAVAALFVIALVGVARGGGRWMAVAGLALGWAVVVEYQAVLAGSVIGLWAAWKYRATPKALLPLIVSGVAGLLPLAAYNFFAFGTLFRIGYSGVVGFEGMDQGLFGLTVPRVAVLRAILVGPTRGLFWVAPVLLVAPVGLWRLGEARATRGIALAAAGVAVVALLVNAAYVYWDGGNATGPRHAMPLAGVAALGLAPVWTMARAGWQRVGLAMLLLGSVAINLTIAAAEIFAPPGYRWAWWQAVIQLRFRFGDLRTIPSEWWGWTSWNGLYLWAAIAIPLALWLVQSCARFSPRTRCQT